MTQAPVVWISGLGEKKSRVLGVQSQPGLVLRSLPLPCLGCSIFLSQVLITPMSPYSQVWAVNSLLKTGSWWTHSEASRAASSSATFVAVICLEPSGPAEQATSVCGHMETRQDVKYMFGSLGLKGVLIIHLHFIEETSGDMKEVYGFLITEHQVKYGWVDYGVWDRTLVFWLQSNVLSLLLHWIYSEKNITLGSYLHMGPLDIMLGPRYAPWLGGAEVGQSWPSASERHGFIEPQRGSHFFLLHAL